MGINHRCVDMFVPQKFLNGSDVMSRFKEMGRKAVTQGVTACPFRQHQGSQDTGIHVMS